MYDLFFSYDFINKLDLLLNVILLYSMVYFILLLCSILRFDCELRLIDSVGFTYTNDLFYFKYDFTYMRNLLIRLILHADSIYFSFRILLYSMTYIP